MKKYITEFQDKLQLVIFENTSKKYIQKNK